jgi:voltage-gated potassium channel
MIVLNENISFLEAILVTIPSFLGEMGSIEYNPTGIASMIGLFVYAGFLGIMIGKSAEFLVNLSLKGGVIMKKIRYKNHIIICGWNYQGPKIIEGILLGDTHLRRPIVILADLDKPPYSSDKVDFVSGSPYKKKDLIRAGIKTADSAIILTDIKNEKTDNPDADALLITLAIESLNQEVHTCVQLLY